MLTSVVSNYGGSKGEGTHICRAGWRQRFWMELHGTTDNLNECLRLWTLEPDRRGSTSDAAVNWLYDLTKPQFPHPYNGDNGSASVIGFCGEGHHKESPVTSIPLGRRHCRAHCSKLGHALLPTASQWPNHPLGHSSDIEFTVDHVLSHARGNEQNGCGSCSQGMYNLAEETNCKLVNKQKNYNT